MAVPAFLWRLSRPKFSVGAAGVIFNADGFVLLVEHVFHPDIPWGLPGGWVDRGETPEQTIRREIKEEVTLDVGHCQIIMIDTPYANHLDIAFLCQAEVLTINQLSYELLNYGWYDPNTLPPILDFHRRAIQQAVHMIKGNHPHDEKTYTS